MKFNLAVVIRIFERLMVKIKIEIYLYQLYRTNPQTPNIKLNMNNYKIFSKFIRNVFFIVKVKAP